MYKRRKAREQAVEIIFENMFNKESVSWIARMAQTYREIEIIPFGKKIAKYAIENQEEIDNLIKKYCVFKKIDSTDKKIKAYSEMANVKRKRISINKGPQTTYHRAYMMDLILEGMLI